MLGFLVTFKELRKHWRCAVHIVLEYQGTSRWSSQSGHRWKWEAGSSKFIINIFTRVCVGVGGAGHRRIILETSLERTARFLHAALFLSFEFLRLHL